MKRGLFSTLICALFTFLVFATIPKAVLSEEITTGMPYTWYVLGTGNFTDPSTFPFILGDNDGYTIGDSCQYTWTGEAYDNDYAIQKYVFKAPFSVIISGIRFSPTASGYNLLYIGCLKANATMDMFTTCSHEGPPFFLSLDGKVISIGARWESYGNVCVDAGGLHRDYQWCLTGGANKLTSWEIDLDENGHVKIYDETDTLVAEGDTGACESGWYMIVIRDFDSTITIEEPIYIVSSEIKEVSEVLSPYGTEEQEGACISEDELQRKIEEARNSGYNEGYHDAIEFCKKNPEECGVEISGGTCSDCAYYNPISNELVVPCFTTGTDLYELKFNIISFTDGITLRLSDYRKK